MKPQLPINSSPIEAEGCPLASKAVFSAVFVGLFVAANPVIAQSIIPAVDGTGTNIQQNGGRFDIYGGTRSQDGGNLFHSFEAFGLSTGEIANFISAPEINNIFGRIVGGNPSIINGLIQVMGENSHLFLMNPAGIVLGQNASLNVPGDFFATTATGIGFGEENWLEAIGSSDYENLVGDPDRLAFDLINSGSIINAANLTVDPGQSLTLLGGNTLNTGTLTASGGTINLTAVPGTNLVRLSRTDNLLSLEFAPPRNKTGEILPFSPLALPELLTGTDLETEIEVVGDRVTLNGTEIPTGTGVAIASGRIDVSGEIGGRANVFGDRVGAIAATIDASGISGGGTILFGGEQQGLGVVPNARQTYISQDSQLFADATEIGNGGRIIAFASENASIHGILRARGGEKGGNGGFIETSGLASLRVTSLPDVSALAGTGGEWLIDPYNITIEAGLGNTNINSTSPFEAVGNDARLGIQLILNALVNGDVTISTGTGGTQDGNITLEDSITYDLATERTLTLTASGTIWLKETINGTATSAPLNLVLNGGNSGHAQAGIRVQNSLNSQGGDITMVGTSNNHRGIWIQSDINSEGGNISLTGTSEDLRGVFLNNKLTSGGGNISITGTSNNLRGVYLNDEVASGGGNISITGTSNNQVGVAVNKKMTSGGGNISITGTSNNGAGIRIQDNIDSGTGDMTLSADRLNLTPSGGLNGSSDLILQPLTSTLDLQVGGTGGTGAIFLTNSELALIDNGFNAITIGRADGSGTITVADDVTFSDPVTLRAPEGNGSINATAGNIIGTDDATITLEANRDIITSNITNSGRDITATSNTGDIVTGAIDTSSSSGDGGKVSLEALRDVQVTSINTASTAGKGGDIRAIAGQFFRATGTFSADGENFSLYSGGNGGGGQITLNHGGGGVTPFDVGNAATNGVLGAIGDGSTLIAPPLSFRFTYIDGQIQIIATDGVEMTNLISIDGVLGKNATDRLLNALQDDLSRFAYLGILEGDRFTVSLAPFDPNIPLTSELIFEEIDRYFTRAFEGYFAAETDTYASTPKSLSDVSERSSSDRESDRVASSEGDEENNRTVSLDVARASLDRVERATGVKPSVIYAIYAPALGFSSLEQPSQPTDQLHLLLVTAKAEPILYSTGLPRSRVEDVARQFRRNVTNVRRQERYLDSSQQLYQWLIAPLEADLEKHGISHLTFILDEGLRSLPIAALHDGNGFIVERYSVSLMPSLSLSDLSYRDLRELEVLAMGSSKFRDREPLPAVPIELDLLSSGKIWQGEAYLNEEFTLARLQEVRDRTPYRMIHLATHSDFQPGNPSDSYILVGEESLGLDRLRELGWHDPTVELLVLSACRTALGDVQAELGFAGISAMAGVKSTLGSLWYVSDLGSLGFMSAFYEQLENASIKAEAVRQAQLAMINRNIRLENENLITLSTIISLEKISTNLSDRDFSHPYYWSAFTLIGTPW